jgi:DNA-binding GntR family transcriptional regulator
MTFPIPKPRADEIADAIRKRICLQPHDEPQVLHEGSLAAQFGVSRTPVRQALQRLAYEGLVEVRTGVGSVVPPMSPAQRSVHFAVHGELLGLVARLPDAPIPPDVARPLGAICARDVPRMTADPATVYAVFTDLNALLSRLIPDPVVADAHLVSGWRIVRWVLADVQDGSPAHTEVLPGLCRNLERTAGHGRVAMFRAASEIVLAAVSAPPSGDRTHRDAAPPA